MDYKYRGETNMEIINLSNIEEIKKKLKNNISLSIYTPSLDIE